MRMSSRTRRIVFGAQYQSVGMVKNTAKVMNHDYVDKILKKCNFLEKAPFSWVHLTFMFGQRNNLKVKFHDIDPDYKDLMVSVELDVAVLQWADKHSHKLLHDIFIIAALEALLQIGNRYKLPLDMIKEERTKFLTIPKNVQACQFYCGPIG